MSIARSYRGMAVFGVVRAFATNDVDLLVVRDLRQQIGEDRRIPNRVGGDFNGPDIKRFCINPNMHLTPLATIGGTVLAGFPLPSPIILIPVLSTRSCKPPEPGRPPNVTGSVFWHRHNVV